LGEYEEEDMETIVWGDYLKHNCFKSWSLLRLHLECNEGSREVGMKIWIGDFLGDFGYRKIHVIFPTFEA
jgi:hypothetical protein